MYLDHWGLCQAPFADGLDLRLFHASAAHEEGLARLRFLVEHHRRVGILLGGSGTGKSLLLEVFAEQLGREGTDVAHLVLHGASPWQLWQQIAAAWKLPVLPSASTVELWRAVHDRLLENRLQTLASVLLLDDVDEAAEATVSEIVRLVHSDPSPACRLTVVAAVRPDRLHRLGRRLLQLATLRIDLVPWEPADTASHVQAALRAAGREDPIFNDDALERLHQLAGGVPRHVRQLADFALLAGAGIEAGRIDVETVEAACRELGVIELATPGV